MNKSTHNELWQVEVGGQIYEAAFSELGNWIGEGSLLPDDKIRKGNLRWTQAKLVPPLVPFFNAKAAGLSMPVFQTTTSAAEPTIAPSEGTNVTAAATPSTEAIPQAAAQTVNGKICLFHPDLSSLFLCEGCGSGFCKTCPKSYGGTVKICPHCGQLCSPVGESKAQQQAGAISSSEDFGFGDFFSALSYPFRFKVSLFLGAVMFMLLTLGRGAAGMGGIFLAVGGIFSGMSANALTFGVLSNTIDNFIQGKFDENFMPEFDDFEFWGDVIHPFFLSIAAYISSFGPFLLVLAIGFYLVTSAVDDQMDAYKSDLERIPGTQVYAGRELADQSGDVKDVLKDIDQKQRERIAAATEIEDNDKTTALITQPTPFVDEESRQQEELWAAANESRKKSLESAIGKMPETQAQEDAAMIKAFLGLAAPLVVIGFITFIWGLIFFPASCAVAGYSRSFVATINPLIGLDTIKRLGVDYVKILAMGFVLLLSSLVVGGILGAIFAVFDMPLVGNLPATALGAIFSFYLMAVFSCILGYALFKSADKLGLAR